MVSGKKYASFLEIDCFLLDILADEWLNMYRLDSYNQERARMDRRRGPYGTLNVRRY